MKDNHLYYHICEKYPNIEYNGEDLKLSNIKANYVKKVWDKYDLKEIANKLNLSNRRVYNIAKENGLQTKTYKK